MYRLPQYDEHRLEVLHALIAAHPFATLIVSAGADVIANHVPVLLRAGPTPAGLLVGHIARANPVWGSAKVGSGSLLIFHGIDHYISPRWYRSEPTANLCLLGTTLSFMPEDQSNGSRTSRGCRRCSKTWRKPLNAARTPGAQRKCGPTTRVYVRPHRWISDSHQRFAGKVQAQSGQYARGSSWSYCRTQETRHGLRDGYGGGN